MMNRTLTAEQIDKVVDAQTGWSNKEREALRKRAHGGDGHALFVVATLGKRAGIC